MRASMKRSTGPGLRAAERPVAGLEEAGGVQHRVVPRLALGVGAAGRRPHQVRAQEEPLPRPGILQREADLQISVQLEPPARRPRPQLLVSGVDQELVEGLALDELRVPGEHLLAARLARLFLSGERSEQPRIER